MESRFVLLSLLVLISCGEKSSKKPSLPPQDAPVVVDLYHQRPLEITQRELVPLIRKKQMTTRFDCNGHISSRKIETINNLAKRIYINYEGKKKAWSLEVYNRTTKKKGGLLFNAKGSFVIDHSPTVFNMKVDTGINHVEYVFYKCPKIVQENGKKVCKEPLVVEKEGLIEIDVDYQVVELAGEREIRPSLESCKKPSETEL